MTASRTIHSHQLATAEVQMTAFTVPSSKTLHQSWEFEALIPCGLVVGVDGSPESVAALNTAAVIARARRCPLHVVSVLPPFASCYMEPGKEQSKANTDELRIRLRGSVIRTMLTAARADDGWTYEVVMGRPAKAIARIAEDRCADLIIVGRREHGIMDRIVEGETTLQVMRLSPVPVLAVSADCDSLQSVVVATDFSTASERAAKVALELLGKSGTLYLVHVEPPVELLPGGFARVGDARYPGDVVTWFRRFIESINPRPGLIVETTVLNGKPVPAILEFAERVGASMIAAGVHSHTRMERFLLGSVSTGLVRNARCPVLVAPAGE